MDGKGIMTNSFPEICIVGNSRNEEVILMFGKNLRKLRLQKDVMQEYLADESGLTQTQITQLEKGKINTSISNLYALRSALDCSFDDFFQE